MTNEEVIRAFRTIYDSMKVKGFEIQECFHVIDEVITEWREFKVKEDKYRWHDLRKNPEDLPDDEREYWVHGVWGSGKVSEGGCVFKKDDGYFDACWNFNVTAWREIEPFDEGNEDDE